MSDTTNELITEQLWEEVEIEYPEVVNAMDNADKFGNKEFARYCEAFLRAKVDEKFNTCPDEPYDTWKDEQAEAAYAN